MRKLCFIFFVLLSVSSFSQGGKQALIVVHVETPIKAEFKQKIYSYHFLNGHFTGHSWDNGKVTKAVTCTAAGTKTYTCTRCKKTRTETIAAAGHKAVKDAAVAAT